MPEQHRLVFLSNAVAGQDDDFNAWYDAHLDEILAIPGFDAAQRFRLSDDQFPPEAIPPSDHRYLAIYEVSIPTAEATAAIFAPGISPAPASFDLTTARPLWFSAAGELQGPAVADPAHKLVVFSNPVSEELDGELNDWYDEHLHEVIGMDAGIVNAQRFTLSADQFPAGVFPPSGHRYLALYDTETAPKHTCDTLAGAMADFEHPRSLDMATLRDWMFTAIGPRRTA